MSPPVPIELLVAGRDLTEPKLSPDGTAVAFVQRWRGASAISLVGVTGGPERLLSTGPDPAPGRGMGGGCFDWLPDGSGVLYGSVDGDIWLQSTTGRARRLTHTDRSCRAPVVSADGAWAVFVVDEVEVWRTPLDPVGRPERIDDGHDDFCFDPAIRPDGGVVAWQAWSPPAMPWDASHIVTSTDGVVQRWRPDGAAAQQPRFMPDGTPTHVHDESGWLNVHLGADGGRPVVAESFEHAGPTWGMGQRSYVPSPDGTRMAFCRNEVGFGRLCVADVATGEITDIGRGGHGQLSWRDDHLVALRTGAVTPTQIVRYDTSGVALGSGRSEPPTKPTRSVLAVGPAAGWNAHDLPEPELIRVDIPVGGDSDGDEVSLHARRYAVGGGRMLCWVHGGPTDQWPADFRPRISYWWSRGWDVLVVDPRGSTGHGRAYQQALRGGWGRLDVDDTAALIRHVHDLGVAQPESTVVIGASSGGLTALGLLADHPALVAGGVTAYPVCDLATMSDATHRFEAHYTDTLVGDTPVDELSPISRADRIRGPLLLFHGTDDPVVPISQSEALVAAIRDAGGTVEFVVYDGEGHGFRDPGNVRDEFDRTERFLRSTCGPPSIAGH